MGEHTVTIQRNPLKKTFTNIGLHMFPFDESYTKVRYKEKDKKCHLCGTGFTDKEKISIAFVKNMKNHLLCERCASDLIAKGVDYAERNRGDN